MITPEVDPITSETIAEPEFAGGGGCVLLVEDDASSRRYLTIVLERAGYEVLCAADGLEAMRILLSKSVNAVVTDAMMPNLNGYELCRFVKSSPKLAHLPLVLLSALDPENAASEAEQVDEFLSKPVSPEELLACLEKLIVRN